MPARRTRNQIELEALDFEIDISYPKNLPVSTVLAKKFYEMAKQIEFKLEACPVCLDDLSCINCFTLLPCSHYLCAPCYLRLPEKKCPVCRAE